jgi:hypothetical protein
MIDILLLFKILAVTIPISLMLHIIIYKRFQERFKHVHKKTFLPIPGPFEISPFELCAVAKESKLVTDFILIIAYILFITLCVIGFVLGFFLI